MRAKKKPWIAPADRTGEDGEHQGQPLVHPVCDVQHGEGRAGDTADRADREVDLTEQQDEDDTDGDHARTDHGDGDVGQVARGEEARVHALEDRGDDDQADDHRDGAELTRAYLAPELGQITGEALLAHEQPGVDRGHRVGGRGRGVHRAGRRGRCIHGCGLVDAHF